MFFKTTSSVSYLGMELLLANAQGSHLYFWNVNLGLVCVRRAVRDSKCCLSWHGLLENVSEVLLW